MKERRATPKQSQDPQQQTPKHRIPTTIAHQASNQTNNTNPIKSKPNTKHASTHSSQTIITNTKRSPSPPFPSPSPTSSETPTSSDPPQFSSPSRSSIQKENQMYPISIYTQPETGRENNFFGGFNHHRSLTCYDICCCGSVCEGEREKGRGRRGFYREWRSGGLGPRGGV